MEEKESTFSGSLGNSDTDSPPPNSFNNTPVSSQAVNTAVNVSSETTLIAPTPPPPPTTTTTTATAQALTAEAPANTGGGVQGNVDLSGKKKRGRPRKYDADGNLRLGQAHNSGHVSHVPPPPGFYLSPSSPNSSEFSTKKGRGRPPGSGNWQVLASLGKFRGSSLFICQQKENLIWDWIMWWYLVDFSLCFPPFFIFDV
jgi:hypothetical protein